MQFSNPIFLWALTGLSIPIGIHLLSRKEGKVIRLGSLRHVHETSTQQFRGIRLNEIWLLILRCLLIALFTFIISGLHWNSVGKKKWLLMEKGLEKESGLITVRDSLLKEGYECHLLAESFPRLEDSASVTSLINYWGLLKKLQAENLSDVIVFALNRVDNFKGLRSNLPANVRWISQSLQPLDYTLQAIQIEGDSVSVREGHTHSEVTHFTTKKMSRSEITAIESPSLITVTLVSDETYAYDQKMVEASLNAIAKSFPIEMKLTKTRSSDSPPDSNWVIWLSDKKIPVVGTSVLLMTSQITNQQELFLREQGNRWVITQRLNEEVALRENLTLKLATLLIPRKMLQEKARTNDRRVISDSIAWASLQSNNKKMEASLSEGTNPYLIVLLVILLFIERYVAYKRNQ